MVTFLGRLAIQAERLDTQIYLNSNSADQAFKIWYKDLASELGSVVNAFAESSWDYATTAAVVSLNEKILERDNQEFLAKLSDFQSRVEEIIATKAIQYAKICSKFAKPQDLEDDTRKLLLEEGETYLRKLDTSLRLLNKFCSERIKDAKKRKVYSLSKYNDLFQRLEKFSTLTRDQMLSELRDKGEV